jgi:hypothetical protein
VQHAWTDLIEPRLLEQAGPRAGTAGRRGAPPSAAAPAPVTGVGAPPRAARTGSAGHERQQQARLRRLPAASYDKNCAIAKQLAFYFSDKNLRRDTFMQRQIKAGQGASADASS